MAAVLLLWCLLWLGVPPLVKYVLQTQGSQVLGRPVSVGDVSFRPWSMELALRDLTVGPAAGQALASEPADQPANEASASPSTTPSATPSATQPAGGSGGASAEPGAPQAPAGAPLHLAGLSVNLSMASLWRWAPIVDSLRLEQPAIRLRRLPDGGYDVDDIVQRFNQPEPAAQDDRSTPRFALYNVTIDGGSVTLDDEVTGARHELSGLTVGLPFLSTLDSQREVTVTPQLSFALNGSQFSSTAEALPFADNRKTSARLQWRDLDLAPYLAYLPKNLPVAPTAGRLTLDWLVSFEQAQATSLHVSGRTEVDDLALADASGKPLAGLRKATVDLADVAPLARSVRLSSVALQGLQVTLERAADGSFPAFGAAPQTRGGKATPGEKVDEKVGEKVAEKASDEAVAAPSAQPAQGEPSWSLALDAFALKDSQLQWTDATTQPQASLRLADVSLDVKQLAWPVMETPATVEAAAKLDDATLAATGSAALDRADVTVRVDGLALASFAPYAASVLKTAPQGAFATETALHWQADPAQLVVDVKQASIDGFTLPVPQASARERGTPVAPAWRRLAVQDAQVDVVARTARVGDIALEAPQVLVERNAQGRWMFEDWLASAPQASPAQAPAKPKAGGDAAPPWKWSLGRVAVKEGDIRYRDVVNGQPVALNARNLDASLAGYAPDQRATSAVDVSVTLSSPRGAQGSLKLGGKLGPVADGVPQGFSADRIQARRLPLQALVPYVPALSKLDVLRADGSFSGQARYASSAQGPQVSAKGDVAVESLRVDSRLAEQPDKQADEQARQAWAGGDRQLLSWKSLELSGLDFSMAPGQRTRLDLAGTTLTDLFARLVVTPQGKLNLQGMYGDDGAEAQEPAQQPGQPSARQSGEQPTQQPAQQTAQQSAQEQPQAGPLINLGPIRMINGQVAFNDQFVKPNYSANLSRLTGRLSAFSSQAPEGQPQMAELELQGVAQETAPLLITGKLNPLVQPLVLDISGKVSDLDLPPLSPYSVKYAGYGIERGKLNVDVNYVVNADGQLTASNRIVVNQLTFGDFVEGGGSLPVKLAVALLADRDGVINVELPVSGSLNDPQFSIGGLVFRALGNLIAKAVTAPFALIGAAFGGGSGAELSTVDFAPGTKWLQQAEQAKLDKVAQAMQDRPSLKLTLVGLSSFEAEQLDYQRAELARNAAGQGGRSRAARTGQASRQEGTTSADAAESADSSDSDDSTSAQNSSAWKQPDLLSGQAYEDAVNRLYRRSDATKPRNFIGMVKKVPLADMEKLLMTEIAVNPQVMQQMAVERAMAVQSYLLSKGIPAERLFLGASKNVTGPGVNWKPRVELQLGLR